MWKKIAYCLLALVCLAGAVVGYLIIRKPNSRPASTITVDMSPNRIARGKYIFNLGDCEGCHSEHEWNRMDHPVVAGKLAAGQTIPDPSMTVYVPNITPDKETGIGTWTDGEKIRAIREGVDKDGNALFPMMPYDELRIMSDDDVQSLVAYLNTLPAVKNAVPKLKPPFPINVMIKSAPRPVLEAVSMPDHSNQLAYGEYLVSVAGCQHCHTEAHRGQIDMSRRYGGGRVFEFGTLKVLSANISPDLETGIGRWDFDRFRDRIYKHREYAQQGFPKIGPELFSVMPWQNLSQLPEEDLQAIFAYLKSQRPIENKVVTHPGAPAQQTAAVAN